MVNRPAVVISATATTASNNNVSSSVAADSTTVQQKKANETKQVNTEIKTKSHFAKYFLLSHLSTYIGVP